ncbi:hypothetical protein C8R43DRAFT_1104684 [Mycena crocata]|nr:hypothetical protein C8R43DRAFT_1104684 [Mycena crocata]
MSTKDLRFSLAPFCDSETLKKAGKRLGKRNSGSRLSWHRYGSKIPCTAMPGMDDYNLNFVLRDKRQKHARSRIHITQGPAIPRFDLCVRRLQALDILLMWEGHGASSSMSIMNCAGTPVAGFGGGSIEFGRCDSQQPRRMQSAELAIASRAPRGVTHTLDKLAGRYPKHCIPQLSRGETRDSRRRFDKWGARNCSSELEQLVPSGIQARSTRVPRCVNNVPPFKLIWGASQFPKRAS